MRAHGWSVTDEVGQARQGHAAHLLRGLHMSYDRANFDPQKFTTLLASGNAPDVVVMDRK